MNVYRGASLLVACLALSGCGSKAEPRSQQYFESHIDEARKVDDGCRDGSVRGDECMNANIAVEEAKGKANRDRFFGKNN